MSLESCFCGPHLERGALDDLDGVLSVINPHLVEIRRGAWSALASSQPDSLRQAAHSGRELIDQVLKEGAPDSVVQAESGFKPDSTSQSGITRRMRLSRKRLDSYGTGLSDRIRAMCFGTLVLIWGLFTQKEPTLFLAPYHQRGLFLVGLGAVAVLALDLFEYVFGYQENRKAAGERVRPAKFDYQGIKTRLVFAKLLTGFVVLSGLSALVLLIVISPAQAQTDGDIRFYGEWCGGSYEAGEYTCLVVGKPMFDLAVKLSLQANGDVSCSGAHTSGDRLSARCGRYVVDAQLRTAKEVVLVIRHGQARVSRNLVRIAHPGAGLLP